MQDIGFYDSILRPTEVGYIPKILVAYILVERDRRMLHRSIDVSM